MITTHDRPNFIRAAVDSVLAQTYKDAEIIVVDDGSSSETEAILRELGERIRVIQVPDEGRARARNAGIAHARGAVIAFLDDDDLWLPEKLASQVAFLEEHPDVGLVHTFTEVVDAQGRLVGSMSDSHTRLHRAALRRGYTYEALLRHPVMYTSSVVVTRSVLDKIEGFDPETEAFEDWDFYLRASRCRSIAVLPRILVQYRAHGTQSERDHVVRGRIAAARKHLGLVALEPPRARRRLEALLEAHIASAHRVRGDDASFLEHARRAVSRRPAVALDRHLGIHMIVSSMRLLKGGKRSPAH